MFLARLCSVDGDGSIDPVFFRVRNSHFSLTDVTLQNVDLHLKSTDSRNAIIANGYALTLDNVTAGTGARSIPTGTVSTVPPAASPTGGNAAAAMQKANKAAISLKGFFINRFSPLSVCPEGVPAGRGRDIPKRGPEPCRL